MQLQRGLQFAPGYRLQEFLGRGQFGQVWRASAPGGTAAAVKFIDLSDGQGQKEYDGIRRVKQIRQANLMPITAIWLLDGEGRMIDEAPDEAVQTIDFSLGNASDHSGMVFMPPEKEPSWLVVAMLLGGKSLQHRLRECVGEGKPGIPPKELISLMDESAKGLDFLNSPIHDLGEGPIAIQHCDVKPANIVLIGNSAVVCDFGLARILTRSQATATSASGTPAYMAPEAIEGKPSCASDQYSLAVTYYQLRTSTLPVNEGSLWEVLDSHRSGKLNFDLVPQQEQAVLRKATSMKWENRFESNVDMVDALREALRCEGESQPSLAAGGVQPGSSPMQQSRLTSPVAGTGGVSLAGNRGSAEKQVAHDPTATIGSEFMRARESAASSSPVGPFGSPELLGTTDIASAQESTRDDLAASTTASDQPVEPNSLTSVAGLSQRILVEAAKRPRATAVGVGGVLLGCVLAGSVLFSGPSEPVIAYGSGESGGNGGQTKDGGGGASVPIAVTPGEKTEQDPLVLVEQARTSLRNNDFDAARDAFSRALNFDPGLSQIQPTIWEGHQKPVAMIEFASKGRQLVTLGDYAFPILWQTESIETGTTPPHVDLDATNGVENNAFAVSPNGQRLVTGGEKGQVLVWNLNTNDEVTHFSLVGHEDSLLAAAWHPNPTGRYVVTASSDRKLGVWEIADGTTETPQGSVARHFLIDTIKMYDALEFDESGERLVALSNDGGVDAFTWESLVGTLETESAPSPTAVKAEGDDARKLALVKNSDGTTAAVVAGGSNVITLWSLENPATDKIDSSKPAPDIIDALRAIVVDGSQVIAAGSYDGTVTVWRRGRSVSTQSIFVEEKAITSIDISQDGVWLAAASNYGSASLMNLNQQDPAPLILPISGQGAMSIKLDPQGRWLFAGTMDGTICVWDLEHVKLLALQPRLHVEKPKPPASDETQSLTMLVQ